MAELGLGHPPDVIRTIGCAEVLVFRGWLVHPACFGSFVHRARALPGRATKAQG